MPWARTRIAELRVKAGFRNGTAAAKVLGCSLIHIREVERGASGVSLEIATKMARAYKVSLEEIEKAIRTARRSHLQGMLKRL
jgi:DNA-binding XRE family transcriptional regulator